MRITESKLFISFVGILAGCIGAAEAYFIHRTYNYFGGGALNRPLAISSSGDYLTYAVLAIFNDLLFYGTAIALSALLFKRITKNLFSVYVVVTALGGLFVGVIIILKWKISEYFKDKFDWIILKELTGGNLLNAKSTIDISHLILGILIFIFIILFIISLRYIVKLSSRIFVEQDNPKFIGLTALWILLVPLHFYFSDNLSLRHGLLSKMSYWTVNEILNFVTDIDGDGYGPLTSPRDTDNFNKWAFPYAVEIPNNGIDENGIAGDLIIEGNSEKEKAAPDLLKINNKNVILIIIETFRADVINREIDGKAITPFLNHLARKYAYTEMVFSEYGVTARAIQTILAGNIYYTADGSFLFEKFSQLNYKTYAISAQNELWGDTYFITGMNKVDGYFDARKKKWDLEKLTTWQRLNKDHLTVSSREINERIFEFIDQAQDNPFFMYVNYQDLHYPYYFDYMPLVFINKGHTGYKFFRPENREGIYRQYANAAHFLDESLRLLFERLKQTGKFNNTVIVIIGDHPDSFFENGILGHAWTLDVHQRQTPLLVINGKGNFTAPIGQAEISNIIFESIDRSTSKQDAKFTYDEKKEIFVLTGTLEQPRQIGFISPNTLVIYDFKMDMFKPGKNDMWVPRKKVMDKPKMYHRFRKLVNEWETALLKRKNIMRQEKLSISGLPSN